MVACGVVDVKSFYLEPPGEVAERLVLCSKYIHVDKLSAVPECGFFPVPHWLAFERSLHPPYRKLHTTSYGFSSVSAGTACPADEPLFPAVTGGARAIGGARRQSRARPR